MPGKKRPSGSVQGPNAERHEWLALQASLDIALHDWEFRDVTVHLGALRPGQRFTAGELQSWLAVAERDDDRGRAMRATLVGAKVDPARLRAYAEKLAQLEVEKRAHQFLAAAARQDRAGVQASLEDSSRARLDATVRRLSSRSIDTHLADAFGSHESDEVRARALVDDLASAEATEATPETTTRGVRHLVDDLPLPPVGSLARADYEAALADLAERAHRTLARRRTGSASSDRIERELEELRDAFTAFRQHQQNVARLQQNVSPAERRRILDQDAAVVKRLEALGITVDSDLSN